MDESCVLQALDQIRRGAFWQGAGSFPLQERKVQWHLIEAQGALLSKHA